MEYKFRNLADLLPQIVFETDRSGNLTHANSHGFKVSGYTQEDLDNGLNALELFIPEDRDRVKKNIQKILDGETSSGNEYTALRKDGSTFPVVVYSRANTREGEPVGLIGIAVDITERKLAERELRRSERRMRALLNASTESMFLCDNKGVILALNESTAQTIGKATDEVLGMNFFDLLPRKVAQHRKKRINEVIRSRKPLRFEDQRGGRVIDNAIYPVLDEQGRVVQLAVYGRDITVQKKAIEKLEKREAVLKIRAKELKEKNIALKVLLEQRDENKKELEERMLLNVKNHILPYVEKLRNDSLNPEQKKEYVDILELNLNAIISPFTRTLSYKYSGLTPAEIQIASLVKDGRRTKEMADLLNVSDSTIEFHRKNIRTKIGLKNKKLNLRTHLMFADNQ